jgi:protein arginine N-methyltransferase 5
MWRQTDERKVWYEWMVDVYAHAHSKSDASATARQAHSKGKGSSYEEQTSVTKVRIGGSELHSSIKEACLM